MISNPPDDKAGEGVFPSVCATNPLVQLKSMHCDGDVQDLSDRRVPDGSVSQTARSLCCRRESDRLIDSCECFASMQSVGVGRRQRDNAAYEMISG